MSHPSFPNSIIGYHAKTIPEYLTLQWWNDPMNAHHRWRCVDSHYNSTHEMWAHTFTKEIKYKPIPPFYRIFNSTHDVITDPLTKIQHFRARDNALGYFLVIFLFLFFAWVLYTLYGPSESKSRSRARTHRH